MSSIQRYKYPRTFHFHNSPNLQNDDRKVESYDGFYSDTYEPKQVIATLKMDGENTTMYRDHIHARSLDSAHHVSRTMVKQIHGQIKHLIPENMRICGENLQACHSIYYTGLPSFFTVFNIWEGDRCLSHEETVMWVDEFRAQAGPVLSYVPLFYIGPFDINEITKAFYSWYADHEGFVVRVIDSFDALDFSTHTAKLVRKGHVQSTNHWMTETMLPNKLRIDQNEAIRCWARSAGLEGTTKES